MYLRFVDCEPVPMVIKHYATPLYALSHVLATCQHNSGVIEPSLKLHERYIQLAHTYTSHIKLFLLLSLYSIFLFFYF